MRSKGMVRLISVFVLICMISTSLAGCSADEEILLNIPHKITETLKNESENEETPVIRFYFNNTAHTQGFFSKKLALNNGKYERGIYDDAYQINSVSFVNAIKNSFDGRYDTTEYSIGCKTNSTDWTWVENAAVYGDCGKSDFYMIRDIDEKNQMKTLLLETPASKDAESSDAKPEINIYLSSLAELNQNMSHLTEWVRNKLRDREDYSVGVLCALCDYNGKIYPTDSSEAVDGKEITGKRPLYLVMMGPTNGLDRYVETLKATLQSAKFTENTDYSVYFFPEKELTEVRSVNDEVVVPATLEDRGDLNPEHVKQLLKSGSFNANINLTGIPQVEFDEVFADVGDYIDLYAFRFTEQKIADDRMILNLYVPLYECNDSSASLYDCYFYDKLDQNDSEEIDRLLEDNSSLEIYRCDLTEDEDDEESDEESEEIKTADFTQINPYEFEKMGFGITTEVISGGEIPAYVFETPLSEDEAEDIEAVYAAKLTESHKWLKLCIEYRFDPDEARESTSVMLSIPVYAVLKSAFSSWFEDCSIASKNYDETNADVLARTCDFLDFMNIIADKELESDELYRARYESKIADIVVCITDIPVAG